jgi:hypothetical protein
MKPINPTVRSAEEVTVSGIPRAPRATPSAKLRHVGDQHIESTEQAIGLRLWAGHPFSSTYTANSNPRPATDEHAVRR